METIGKPGTKLAGPYQPRPQRRARRRLLAVGRFDGAEAAEHLIDPKFPAGERIDVELLGEQPAESTVAFSPKDLNGPACLREHRLPFERDVGVREIELEALLGPSAWAEDRDPGRLMDELDRKAIRSEERGVVRVILTKSFDFPIVPSFECLETGVGVDFGGGFEHGGLLQLRLNLNNWSYSEN